MPHYFFHFRENGHRLVDDRGLQLASRREARHQAGQTLSAIVAEALRKGASGFDGGVDVVDLRGRTVMSANISYNQDKREIVLSDPSPVEMLSRRIARAQQHVALQRDRVARLADKGLPTRAAVELLQEFERTSSLLETHLHRRQH